MGVVRLLLIAPLELVVSRLVARIMPTATLEIPMPSTASLITQTIKWSTRATKPMTSQTTSSRSTKSTNTLNAAVVRLVRLALFSGLVRIRQIWQFARAIATMMAIARVPVSVFSELMERQQLLMGVPLAIVANPLEPTLTIAATLRIRQLQHLFQQSWATWSRGPSSSIALL
jgi:hypothetical protein